MILTENINIKTTNKNIGHYKEIGFDVKSGDNIIIKPENLPINSRIKIKVKCDICGNEKHISYYSYKRNIMKYNYYTCSQKCAYDKNIKTNINKYGVESYTKTKDYINKTRKTKKEKYGDEKYVNIEKLKETCLFKYGVDSYMKTDDFKIKTKETNINKYGVEYPLQSKEIMNKLIKTNRNKYGVDYVLQNEEIINKSKEIKKERYGYSFYNNRDKYKETCKEIYGVDNPMKHENIRRKFENNMYEKYGVHYPSQYEDFFDKMIKNGLKVFKYKDTDIYYQGTYEKDFLDNYYHLIDIKRGDSIKYKYNGKTHTYYPDFYIEKLNLIVEIKSSKWFNEHKNKNLEKEKECRKLGYNFIFIIDKDYDIFNRMVNHLLYKENHSWQYDIRLKRINEEIDGMNLNLSIKDFEFEYVDKSDDRTKDIVEFVKKYEWLGTMPNRPTHRFIAKYNNIIAGVVVMSIPNSFSKILGNDTKGIEKLISRGACASWTPKNLASSLIMYSIKWMVKNTEFRVFSAYADPEAKELGTIYQSCNFIYIGYKYGTIKMYFDPLNKKMGWTSGRNFTKLNYYKKYLKDNNIRWDDNWNIKTKILWDKIPNDIKEKMKLYTKKSRERCMVRYAKPKHKYIYILGKDKRETKLLRNKFKELNPKLLNIPYPKNR